MRTILFAGLCVFCAGLQLSTRVNAGELVVLSAQQGQYSLGKSLDYLVDPKGRLSIEQVSSPEYETLFKPSQSTQPNFGFTSNVYWIRIRLKNETTEIDHWYLQQGFANTHYLDLYLPTTIEHEFSIIKSGTLRPLESRPVDSHLITFKIPLAQGSEKTIYLRVKNGTAITLDFNIYSPQSMLSHNSKVAIWMGLFFGFLIAMLCYSVILYFSLHERPYLYLVIFIATAIAIFSFYDGYAQLFLTESTLSLNKYAFSMLVGIHMLALTGFARSFFEIDSLSSKYNPLYKISIIAWIAYLPLVLVLPDHMVRIVMIVIGLSSAMLVLATGIHSWRTAHGNARYFVISWAINFVALLVMSLTKLDIITNTQFTEPLFHLGIDWQILFIAMALADRVNQLKEEAHASMEAQVKSEKQLGLAMQASRMGAWHWDMRENILHWSDQTEKMFGLKKGEFGGTLEFYKTLIHPEDLAHFEQVLQQSIDNIDMPYFVEHRIIRADGSIRWVAEYGEVQRDTTGQPLGMIGSIQDISIRKQYEEEYVRSEKKYTAIFENANDAIVLLEDGMFVDGNSRAFELFGCNRSEFLGKSPLDFSPEFQPNGESSINLAARRFAAVNREGGQSFEWLYEKTDGTLFYVDINLNRIEFGEYNYLQAILRDITERKRSEEAIRNIALGVSSRIGDNYFQELVVHLARLFDAEYAFVGFFSEDNVDVISTCAVCAHGEITKNISYSRLRTPCEKVIGKSICIYPSDVQAQFPEDKLLVEMGVESYIGAPMFDSNGSAMGVLVVMDCKPMKIPVQIEEILQIFATRASTEMERLRADQHLRDAKQRLALHIKQTPLGVIEWDTQFRVTAWNASARKIFGYTEEEVIGRHATDLIIPLSVIPTVNEVWQDLLKKKGGYRSSNKNLTKDNKLITCEWYNTTLIDDEDKVIGVASLVSDITERVNNKEELERHRDSLEEMVTERTSELQAVNKELETFSYSVSHDLRAPLRSICGFSEALMEDYAGKLDGEGLDYLQRLRSASLRMDDLIRDMLSLSRINRQEMKYESVSLSLLVKDILEEFHLRDKERKASFKIQAGLKVWCDSHIIRIALENMLNNAWKYSSKRENTEISFGLEKKSGEMNYYIKDNGVGFDMRYADILFDPFRRLHGRDEFEGSGVGLATVKRAIVRHGGSIWANSEVNKGSTFYFTLPRRIAKTGKKETDNSISLPMVQS